MAPENKFMEETILYLLKPKTTNVILTLCSIHFPQWYLSPTAPSYRFMEYYMIPGFVVIEVISVDAYGLHGLLTFTIAPPSMGKASQMFLEASFSSGVYVTLQTNPHRPFYSVRFYCLMPYFLGENIKDMHPIIIKFERVRNILLSAGRSCHKFACSVRT